MKRKQNKELVRITTEAEKRLRSFEMQTGRSRQWIVSSLILHPTEAVKLMAEATRKRREAIRRKIKNLTEELQA